MVTTPLHLIQLRVLKIPPILSTAVLYKDNVKTKCIIVWETVNEKQHKRVGTVLDATATTKHARLKHYAKWGFIVTMVFENHATRVNIVLLGPGPTKALAPTIV